MACVRKKKCKHYMNLTTNMYQCIKLSNYIQWTHKYHMPNESFFNFSAKHSETNGKPTQKEGGNIFKRYILLKNNNKKNGWEGKVAFLTCTAMATWAQS